MENLTQITTAFGIASATLAILLLVMKFFIDYQKKQQDFFVEAIHDKDILLIKQYSEIKSLTERCNVAVIKFTEALAANTESNKHNADSLTKVVFELMNKHQEFDTRKDK